MRVADLDRRHDVRLHPAHQVRLHPVLPADGVLLLPAELGLDLAPLGIAPTLVDPRREAGAVDREVPVNFRQGPGRLHDELLEVWRQRLGAEVVEDAVVARQLRQVALLVRLPQVGREAAARDGRIDFEGCGEDGVRQRQAAATCPLLDRLLYPSAKLAQQKPELRLLVDLRGVVGRPDLRVGRLSDLRRVRELDVAFALQQEADRVDVLTLDPVLLEVGAGAGPDEVVDGIPLGGGLGRDDPDVPLTRNLRAGGDLQPFGFPRLHCALPPRTRLRHNWSRFGLNVRNHVRLMGLVGCSSNRRGLCLIDIRTFYP